MANQGDNCRYYIRIYIGGVNLFYTRLTAEALTCRLRGCLGGLHSLSVEWLPRWVAFTFSRMVASVG